MQLLYKKILEVQVWHDYYLWWEVLDEESDMAKAIDVNSAGDETPFETITKILEDDLAEEEALEAALQEIVWATVEEVPGEEPGDDPINIYTVYRWPEQYTILNDLDFVPTPQCTNLMRDQQIIFRKTPLGFVLLAKAKEVEPITDPPSFYTTAFIDDALKFDFFVIVKNPYFFNFTNLRLVSKEKPFYHFTNKNRTVTDTDQLFLTSAHSEATVGVTTDLYLGDIVDQGDQLFEINKNVISPATFAAADGTLIWHDDTRYVSHDDCLPWQFPNYEYRNTSNSHPGEVVTFTLRDIDGASIELGKIANTTNNQARYQAPSDAGQALFHTINLADIPSGKYTMEVQRISGTETSTFFLLNPLLRSDAFGMIELFPYATDFEFVQELNNESVIDAKLYQIRFKNRSTVWQYFNKDGSEETDPGDEQRLPLTNKLSEFKVSTDVLPDPDISIIYPVKDTAGNIEKIYSKTYLNQ